MKQKQKYLLPLSKNKMLGMPNCRMLNVFNQKGLEYSDDQRPGTKVWDDIRSFYKVCYI
jgi:hypothetical protein